MCIDVCKYSPLENKNRKEGNVLFNDALITFYLQLYGVGHMAMGHSYSERGNSHGRGMCYPVCGMMYIKEPLLLIGKSSPCGGSGFPLSLSKWPFTICLTQYNAITMSDAINKMC